MGVNKELVILSSVAFFSAVSNGMATLPFSIYARELGASMSLIGLTLSLGALTGVISALSLGVLSDELGKKPVIAVCIAFLSLGSFLHALATDPYYLVLYNALRQGVGLNVFGISMALVTDMTDLSERGKAMGFFTTFMGVGYGVGLGMGGWFTKSWGFKITYYVSSLVALLTLVIVLSGIKNKIKQPISRLPNRTSFFRNLHETVQIPGIWITGLTSIFTMLMSSAIMTFFPIYVKGRGLNEADIGLIMFVRSLFSSAIRMPIGALSRIVESKILILLAMISMTLVTFSIPHTMLYYIIVFEGIGFGMFLTASSILIANLSLKTKRGTAQGFFGTFSRMGSVINPIFSGLIADIWGIINVFHISASLAFFWILALIIYYKKSGTILENQIGKE